MNIDSGSHGQVVRALGLGVGAQAAGKCVHLALNIVVSLALIRYLGPRGYGDYIFALTFAGLVGLLSDLGLSKVAVREMARDDDGRAALLGTSVAARLALAVGALLLGQGLLWLAGADLAIHAAVAVASLLNLVDALLSIAAVFQVNIAMHYDAIVSVTVQAVDTVLVLAFIWRGLGLVPLIAAPVISGLIGFLLAVVLARGRFEARASIDLRRLPKLLVDGLPIGLALICAYTYLKFDAVLLALLRDRVEVGIYGAAYRPVEYLLLASTVVITALFPLLSRWHANDERRFRLVYQRGAESLLALSLPVPVLLVFVAPPLVALAYTGGFAAAALPLQMLGVALVLMVFNAWQAFTLMAANRQRLALAYDAAAVAVNVGLNLALIPRFGYMGAATSALATACFITICGSVAVSRMLQIGLAPSRMSRLLAANALLAVALWLLTALAAPWWVAVVAAALVYPPFLLLTGVTNLGELKLFVPRRRPLAVSAVRAS